jgi:hypothetical protein
MFFPEQENTFHIKQRLCLDMKHFNFFHLYSKYFFEICRVRLFIYYVVQVNFFFISMTFGDRTKTTTYQTPQKVKWLSPNNEFYSSISLKK